ncbi:hypothetical protein GN956_G24714 [Arapaima gigas]
MTSSTSHCRSPSSGSLARRYYDYCFHCPDHLHCEHSPLWPRGQTTPTVGQEIFTARIGFAVLHGYPAAKV